MARLGMDVDEVERVAAGLHSQAGNLGHLIQSIDQLVNAAVHAWDGDDSRQFHEWWNSQHKPALNNAMNAIDGLSQAAKNNASAQRQVSGP